MKRYIPDIHDFAAQKKLSLRQVMDFTTTVNPLGPSTKAKNAVRKNVKIMGHHPDRETRHLGRVIALMEGVRQENVLICESFHGLVSAIFQASGTKKALIGAPYPAYYRELLAGGPIDIIFSSLDETNRFSLDLDGWIEKMARSDAAILTYPSFVSALVPSREEILKIIGAAGERNTLLLVDETLREYSGNPSLGGEILGTDGCLVVRSLSEYYALAGLPVAYAIGKVETIQRIRQLASITPPGTFAAAAAVSSLRDRAYRKRTQAFMKHERSFIEERLLQIRGISFFMTGCGFFVIVLNEHPLKPMETFLRYRIIIDELNGAEDTRCMFFPVKDHKWNARYLKTLKNIMGAQQ